MACSNRSLSRGVSLAIVGFFLHALGAVASGDRPLERTLRGVATKARALRSSSSRFVDGFAYLAGVLALILLAANSPSIVAILSAAGNQLPPQAPSGLRVALGETVPPVISGVAAGSMTVSGATISWTTNEPSDSQVMYGLTTAHGSVTALNGSLVTAHAVTLSSLVGSTLYHFRVRSRDAAGNLAISADGTFTTPPPPGSILWSADHEEGNMSDWYTPSGGGEFNSGGGVSAASTDVAHSGRYSAKATISTPPSPSAVRLFRWKESRANQEAYYSTWMYIPRVYTPSWWIVFQFKSRASSSTDPDPFWFVQIGNRSNGTMYFYLTWWHGPWPGGTVEGPHQGEFGGRDYHQTIKDIPVGKWVHLEAYLRQSSSFDGQITVWQDGVEILNQNNVKTRYPYMGDEWAPSSYSGSISPSPATIYFDDAAISTTRLGPGSTPPPPASSFVIGDRIQTINNTNVRTSGSLLASLLGTQPIGATGTIIGGPVSADGFTWWNINYDTGVDGWSGENNYTKVD